MQRKKFDLFTILDVIREEAEWEGVIDGSRFASMSTFCSKMNIIIQNWDHNYHLRELF